jgi:hypothetical protein
MPNTKLPKLKSNEKIDLDKAIELRCRGMSYTDIAKYFNCTKSAVSQRLTPLLGDLDISLETFKKHRADIMAGKGAELLNSLTPDEIKKIPPGSRLTGYGILYDKERLERGESTSNIDIHQTIRREHELEAKLRELDERLERLDH